MTVCPNIPRITIPNVLYTIRRPPWRTGIILIAITGNTSPNLENRELTGGYGALRYQRWRLDVERFIMQRTIERRYTIIQCVLGKGKYQFCTDSIDQKTARISDSSILVPTLMVPIMHAMAATNVELSI